MKLKIAFLSFFLSILSLFLFSFTVYAQTCNNNGSCDLLETCLTCSSDCGSCPIPTLPLLPGASPTPTPSSTNPPVPTPTPSQSSSSNNTPVVNQTINIQSQPSTSGSPVQTSQTGGTNTNNASVVKKQIKVNKKEFPSKRIVLPSEDVELVFSKDSFDEEKTGWTIVFPNEDTNVTFDFEEIIQGGQDNQEVVLPEKITMEKPVGESNLTILIPQDTIISASHLPDDLTWDGKFDGPKLLSSPQACANDKKIQMVFGVGRENLQIVFSKLVEITFPGRYKDQGAYCFDKQVKEIKNSCTNSSANDCYLAKGNDLVIKTNHFTQFMTYDKPLPFAVLALISLLAILIIAGLAVFLFIKLKISEKLGSEYLSTTAHELKTPMSAIKGYLSMILRGDFGPVKKDLKEPLENMSDSAENLLNMTNDVLDESKLKSGKLKLTLSNFSTDKIINDVFEELIPLAKEKNLELKKASKESSASVYADEGRVKEILVNLVGNAIKYTDKGSVEISTEAEDKKLNIYVKDTGIGISKESEDKLFKKFERLDKKKNSPTGTGLGLYISKEIAKKMGGDLWLKQSEEGLGSTFAFSLPISDVN